MKKSLNKIVRFLPSVVWMMVIFYFSSRSTTGFGPTNPDSRFLLMKSFHLIEYAALGILLYYGYKKYSLSIITAYLYACTDEFHQSFTPGRTPRFTDTLIDLLGITLGSILIANLLKIKFVKKIFN